MTRRIQFQTLLLGLLVLAFLSSGCSAYKKLPFFSTATPYPTNTPYPTTTPYPTATSYPTLTPFPTFTPYPTFTPPPTQVPVMYNWDVKVLSVAKSLTFGTWYYDASQNSEFIILTIEYTNKGQETHHFLPHECGFSLSGKFHLPRSRSGSLPIPTGRQHHCDKFRQ